jgi:uncharacterized protein (TIGR00661 family)
MRNFPVSVSCLFLINGLGMGNSTRCHAVIENLAAAGVRVHVLTSGNGLKYFANRPEIASLHEMESFYYSGYGGGVDGWSTLKSVGALAQRAKAKRAKLEQVIAEVKPDIAVTDSEYATAPLRRRKIPIAAINNSEVVVTEFFKHRHEAKGVRSHFWFVEFSDYLFHRRFCDLILSPYPLPVPTRHPKFKRIGLIVRRAVRELCTNLPAKTVAPRELKNVVFMLSGSVHATQVNFDNREFPFHVDVVGRDGNSHGNIQFHGRLMNNIEILNRADVLVINGGYSALSEAFAFRKPTFVLPVPGHAEQFVNSRLAYDLGLGFNVTEADLLDRLMQMYEKNFWLGKREMPPKFHINGDTEAADAILEFAKKRP